ncbi:MAG TPA: hypothetical protein VMT12_08115 [Syntrophales bacterium]|nr:hypothetical protein [Syntrophales bacterium]
MADSSERQGDMVGGPCNNQLLSSQGIGEIMKQSPVRFDLSWKEVYCSCRHFG